MIEVISRHSQRGLLSSTLCRSCLRRLRLSQTGRIGLQNSRRNVHPSPVRYEDPSTSQAQPLGGFYEDLLSAPLSQVAKRQSELPTFVRSGDLTKEERAARLFGTIKGSGYEKRPVESSASWRTINGVPVPSRPPEPDNCCMSGCMHCVWDDYRDDLEQWAARSQEAQAKGQGSGMRASPKADMHRPEVTAASVSMDDDGGGSERLWDNPTTSSDSQDLYEGIPVGIREFMNVEKKIRDRKKARTAREGNR